MSAIFKLGVFLTVSLFVSGVTMIAAARLTQPDPLASYQTIMPGQSFDAVDAYSCPSHVGMSNGEEAGFCQMDASDGMFSRITVINANHRITRMDLVVLPGRLRLGDLMACWGMPSEVVAYGQMDSPSLVNLRWQNRMNASLTRAQYEGNTDYYLPVTALSLQANYAPCIFS